MHAHSMQHFRHEHVFLGSGHDRNERRSWIVIGICGAMMVTQIGGGALFGSMALIADGLHMSTHAGALFIAALAYTYARRLSRDDRFTFGTGKLGDLAAFTSAIALAMIALLIGYESINRLFHPVHIAFNQAIPIAFLGLGVNLLSAWLLRDDHEHVHTHNHANEAEHAHDDHHHEHLRNQSSREDRHASRDNNLRAAYVHVLADAAVSVLAIAGLLAGRQLGWVWMDAVMGMVGACVIASWSWGLVKAAGAVLLDMRPRGLLVESIAQRLHNRTDKISDLHVWRIGPGHCAAVVALVSDDPKPPSAYKAMLSDIAGLSHVTVEVERCPGAH
ncbi:MAG TPA: CDF family Co(II)/Ni(II) efflux transporter DmeF [Rhizomicrobium sp.]|nr:CDF family Co(II)/Ni(II) efflux transporter DmeF [Rhizomicrobium sp.]